MSFFPPPEEAPEPPEHDEWIPPVWWQAPEDEVPSTVGAPTVVTRTARAALVLRPIEVYSSGVRFTVDAIARRTSETPREWRELTERMYGAPHTRPGAPRFGIAFPDGAVLIADVPFGLPDAEEAGPRLTTHGGGGGGGQHRVTFEHRLWLWPFPSGSFELVVDWQHLDVPEARLAVDGDALTAARASAHPLWD